MTMEPNESTTNFVASSKLNEDAQLISTYAENSASGNPTPKCEQSNPEVPASTLPPAVAGDTCEVSLRNGLRTESPPVQVMDRSGNSSYRIPSSVFARTKSTNPMEWSLTSNESLFSIQMGNASFSNDHAFWPSGEFSLPGEVLTSGKFVEFSPELSAVDEASYFGKGSEGICVAEASVKNMEEVPRETAEDENCKKVSHSPNISHTSNASGASTKSFAFPILTGASIDASGGSMKMTGSVKVSPEQPELQPQQIPSSPPLRPDSKTPAPIPKKARNRWASCCSCCSCCPFCS